MKRAIANMLKSLFKKSDQVEDLMKEIENQAEAIIKADAPTTKETVTQWNLLISLKTNKRELHLWNVVDECPEDFLDTMDWYENRHKQYHSIVYKDGKYAVDRDDIEFIHVFRRSYEETVKVKED